MDYATALNLLGLEEGASTREVEIAYRNKWEELQRWGREAPTEELKAQCWQTLEQLARARDIALDPEGTNADTTDFRPDTPSSDSWLSDYADQPTAHQPADHPTVAVGSGSGHHVASRPGSGFHQTARPRLQVEDNGRLLNTFLLGEEFSVGRADDNTLCLDRPLFSRHHFRLVQSGAAHLLIDLGSLNGTFVNGKSVQRHELSNGDVIQVGEVRLTYLHAVDLRSSGSRRLPLAGSAGRSVPLIAASLVVAAALVLLIVKRDQVRAWLAGGADSTTVPTAADSLIELRDLNVEDGALLNTHDLTLEGRVEVLRGPPLRAVFVRPPGDSVYVERDGRFAVDLALHERDNRLEIVYGDKELNLYVRVDSVEPHVKVNFDKLEITAKSNEILTSLQLGNAPMRETDGLIHQLPIVPLPVEQTTVLRGYDRAGNEGGASVYIPSIPVLPSQRRTADSLGVELVTVGPWDMGFVLVPGGEQTLGSPRDEAGRFSNETEREVEVTRPFYIKCTEVTQAEYAAVMGHNPSYFQFAGLDAAVESVSWYEAVLFCNRLSELEGLEPAYRIENLAHDALGTLDTATVTFLGLDRTGYRLPTEAEWEYACRAGTRTALPSGAIRILGALFAPEIDEIGWYGGNSRADYQGAVDSSGWDEKQLQHLRAGVQIVARKRANRFGLYDTIGNVWEWCWDVLAAEPPGGTDPIVAGGASARVVRGGSWVDSARESRSARRRGSDPRGRSSRIGFRPVRTVP